MSETQPVLKPKRKRHLVLWTLLLIPLLVVGVVFALLNVPKQAGTKFTQSDLDSYLAKGGIILNENSASFEEILAGKSQSIGAKHVEATLTSAEATAILNETLKANSVLKNIRIAFTGEDTVTASATITDDLSQIYTLVPEASKYDSYLSTLKGKSLYIRSSLSHDGNKFVAKLSSISVGSLPLPVGEANSYGTMLGTALNDAISKVANFDVESFNVDEQGLHFKGTIPQEVRSLASN